MSSKRVYLPYLIYSETIYNDIIKLGGKERKSLDVKFPHIPRKLIPDFIRGLWDGDGSIYYCDQKKAYVSSYSSSSGEFINKLYLTLKDNIPNLDGSLKKYNNEYSLRFSTNDTVRLKKFIYQESIERRLMLKRKYDLFLKTSNYCSREFLEYNDAQKIVWSMGIKCHREWRQCCGNSLIPHNIPRNPYSVYKNSGWIDWYEIGRAHV